MDQCRNQASTFQTLGKGEDAAPGKEQVKPEFSDEATPKLKSRFEDESSGNASSCSHCRHLIHRLNYDGRELSTVDEDFYRQCFHDPCDKCDELSKRFGVNLRVCTFCQHLRLGHLYRCVLPSLPDEHHERNASICIHVEHYRQGQMLDCDLCKMLSGALDSMAKPTGEVSLEILSWGFVDLKRLHLQILDGNTVQKLIEVSRTEARFFEPYDHLGEEVNWIRVRGWDKHPSNEYPDLPLEFRVIDVLKNCLVIPRPPFRYVTLSYVWGSPSQGEYQCAEVQATLEKVRFWENEGSLPVLDLPATIQDAMTSCRNLGYRYLWVDRLCIPQDSPELKHDQISQMDAIYALSELTIVAAAGKDAGHGLEGVSQRRSFREEILYWEGLEMKAPFPRIQEIVSESNWATRGWTFQEGICASNILYFTEKGVFGDCKRYSPMVQKIFSVAHSEQQSYETAGKTFRNWNYFDCVKDYTKRYLTHSTDVLNAFAGITHQLEPDIGRHCEYGLPLELFDDAILWQPLHGYEKPRTLTSPGVYPSWSWCSVQGPITYPFGLREHWIFGSVASWAFPSTTDSRGSDSLTEVPFVPFMKEDRKLQYYMGGTDERDSRIEKHFALFNAWEQGFFIKKYFKCGPIHLHDMEILLRNFRLRRSAWIQSQSIPWNWVQHARTTQPLFLEAFSRDDRTKASEREGRVLVLSQATWFELEYTEQLNSWHAFLIRSSEGLLSGTIWLTQHVAESHASAAMTGSRQCMEFLALSIALGTNTIAETAQQLNLLIKARPDWMWDIQTKPYVHGEDDQGWKLAEEISFDRRSLPRLNVMLITRRDGVAQRLGIGQIYMDRWKEANPQFCTTVLE